MTDEQIAQLMDTIRIQREKIARLEAENTRLKASQQVVESVETARYRQDARKLFTSKPPT